jgi:GNAT superfamily N-acetyltransferase
MKLKKEILKDSYAVLIKLFDGDSQVARAYLYILTNSLHKEPFGFLEDVFVEEGKRGKGTGTKIVEAAIAEAKKLGCYKLIGTSRDSKPEVHRFYERLGFKKHGVELRIDF